MNVTVYGGGYKKLTEHEINQCKKMGKFLASIGAEVLTGGGSGIPYQVGKAAVENGARVYGRSPARNAKEHQEKYNFKFDGVTDMIYIKKSFSNPAEGLIQRMNDMQHFSDVVISMGGNWGTFYELILSLYYKKTIIIINEFDGAGEMFQQAHQFFGARDFNPKVHLGANLLPVRDVDEAIKVLKSLRGAK
jgi:predicted Rossmann-fold nucleotide-binding protein